jgi:predicted ATPase
MKENNIKFGVSNFRVFKEMSEFEFAPITFLTGPNSSGKSSVMKALQLFSENVLVNSNKEVYPFFLDFNKTNLESITNVLNNPNENLIFKFNLSLFNPNDSEIKFHYNNGIDLEHKCIFNTERIIDDSQLLKIEFEFEAQKLFCIDFYDPDFQDIINQKTSYFDLNLFRKIIIKKLKLEKDFFDKYVKNPHYKKVNEVNDALSESESYFKMKIEDEMLTEIGNDFTSMEIPIIEKQNLNHWITKDSFEHFSEISIIFENKTNMLELIIQSLLLVHQHDFQTKYQINNLSSTFQLTKIGEYIFNNGAKFILEKIENTIKKLKQINYVPIVKKQDYTRFINLSNTSSFFDVILKKYYNYCESIKLNDNLDINKSIKHWISLEKFGIGKEIKLNKWKDVLSVSIIDFNNNETNLNDLGYGVRQIITLILLPLLANLDNLEEPIINNVFKRNTEPNIFYLEEPESNLHPKWQSLLTELLEDLNQKYGFRFIIETHSEYMIRKAQYMTAKENKLKEKFKIYYFNGPNFDTSTKKYYEIKINPNGFLDKDFGTGFVDEASNLTIDLLKISSYN